jgi:small subunit ribosomal protein S8
MSKTTDPISDLFTIIRNGLYARKGIVDVPFSKFKSEILRVLKENGYINNYKFIEYKEQGILRVYLKYYEDGTPAIRHISRVSLPSRRIYRKAKELKTPLKNLGILIVSTSKGVMTDRQCRKLNIGGEVVGYVW